MTAKRFFAGLLAVLTLSAPAAQVIAITPQRAAILFSGAATPPLSTYQSVWHDSFQSLSLRTGGPTPAGLAAGKGIWADVGLYYNPGTGSNAMGYTDFGWGWFVDHSFNWSAVDPTYPPLGQLDIESDGLYLIGGGQNANVRAAVPIKNFVQSVPTGSGWYDNQGATGSTGTPVDGLPAPRVVISPSNNATARREYFQSIAAKAGQTLTFSIDYTFGTSNSLFVFVSFGGSASSGTIFGNTFTAGATGAGTMVNPTITNFANHSNLTFQMTPTGTPSSLNMGVGPNSPVLSGQTVIFYDMTVSTQPYLSGLVSGLYSMGIKPPFYREVTFNLPSGTTVNDWAADWGLGVDTSNGQFEVDDFDAPGPGGTSDEIFSALHTPQGSNSVNYPTGTPVGGRDITIGTWVTKSFVAVYYGGRSGTLMKVMPVPSGAEWNQYHYSILDEATGFSFANYPFALSTTSTMKIKRVEYFAPPSNTSYYFPPAPPVPALAWDASFPNGAIPVGTPNGTVVGTLSGAAGGYSVLGTTELVVSGTNLVTSGTLSSGTVNFYIQGLDASGNPGIAPRLTATIS